MFRRYSSSRLSVIVLGLVLGLLVSSAPAVRAQSLDDELVRILENSCALLNSDPTNAFPSAADVGTGNLFDFCNAGTTATGSSSGGGTASLQSSMFSVKNDLIKRRIELARGGGDNPTEAYLLEHGYSSPRVAANNWNYLAVEASDDNEADFRAKRFATPCWP